MDRKSPRPDSKRRHVRRWVSGGDMGWEAQEQPARDDMQSADEAKGGAGDGARRIANDGARRITDDGARRTADIGARRIADIGARRTADIGARRTADIGAWRTADIGARRTADIGAPKLAETRMQRVPHVTQRTAETKTQKPEDVVRKTMAEFSLQRGVKISRREAADNLRRAREAANKKSLEVSRRQFEAVLERIGAVETRVKTGAAEVLEPNSAAEALEPNSAAEALELNSAAEVLDPNSAAEALEPNSAAESLEPNSAAEALEPNSAAEALEPNSTAEALELNSAAEALEPNSTAEALELNSAAEALEPNSAAEALEPNSAAEALEPNSTAEALEPNSAAEALEPNSAAEALELNSAAEALELNSAAEALELNSAAEALELNSAAEALEPNSAAEALEESSTECTRLTSGDSESQSWERQTAADIVRHKLVESIRQRHSGAEIKQYTTTEIITLAEELKRRLEVDATTQRLAAVTARQRIGDAEEKKALETGKQSITEIRKKTENDIRNIAPDNSPMPASEKINRAFTLSFQRAIEASKNQALEMSRARVNETAKQIVADAKRQKLAKAMTRAFKKRFSKAGNRFETPPEKTEEDLIKNLDHFRRRTKEAVKQTLEDVRQPFTATLRQEMDEDYDGQRKFLGGQNISDGRQMSSDGQQTSFYGGKQTSSDGQQTSSDDGQLMSSDDGQPTPSDDGQPTPSDEGQLTPSDDGQLTPSDDGQLTPSDDGQLTPSDDGQLTPSDDGQLTSSGDGQLTSSGDGPQMSSGDGHITSSGDGQITSSGDGQITSSGDGQITSSGDGQITSSGDGQITSSGDGQITSSGFGQFTSSGDGPQTSSGDGPQTSSGDELLTSSGDGPQTSAGDGPQTSAGDGPQTSAGDGPQTSAGDGPQTSAGDGPQTSAGGQLTSTGDGQRTSTGDGQLTSAGDGPQTSSDDQQLSDDQRSDYWQQTTSDYGQQTPYDGQQSSDDGKQTSSDLEIDHDRPMTSSDFQSLSPLDDSCEECLLHPIISVSVRVRTTSMTTDTNSSLIDNKKVMACKSNTIVPDTRVSDNSGTAQLCGTQAPVLARRIRPLPVKLCSSTAECNLLNISRSQLGRISKIPLPSDFQRTPSLDEYLTHLADFASDRGTSLSANSGSTQPPLSEIDQSSDNLSDVDIEDETVQTRVSPAISEPRVSSSVSDRQSPRPDSKRRHVSRWVSEGDMEWETQEQPASDETQDADEARRVMDDGAQVSFLRQSGPSEMSPLSSVPQRIVTMPEHSLRTGSRLPREYFPKLKTPSNKDTSNKSQLVAQPNKYVHFLSPIKLSSRTPGKLNSQQAVNPISQTQSKIVSRQQSKQINQTPSRQISQASSKPTSQTPSKPTSQTPSKPTSQTPITMPEHSQYEPEQAAREYFPKLKTPSNKDTSDKSQLVAQPNNYVHFLSPIKLSSRTPGKASTRTPSKLNSQQAVNPISQTQSKKPAANKPPNKSTIKPTGQPLKPSNQLTSKPNGQPPKPSNQPTTKHTGQPLKQPNQSANKLPRNLDQPPKETTRLLRRRPTMLRNVLRRRPSLSLEKPPVQPVSPVKIIKSSKTSSQSQANARPGSSEAAINQNLVDIDNFNAELNKFLNNDGEQNKSSCGPASSHEVTGSTKTNEPESNPPVVPIDRGCDHTGASYDNTTGHLSEPPIRSRGAKRKVKRRSEVRSRDDRDQQDDQNSKHRHFSCIHGGSVKPKTFPPRYFRKSHQYKPPSKQVSVKRRTRKVKRRGQQKQKCDKNKLEEASIWSWLDDDFVVTLVSLEEDEYFIEYSISEVMLHNIAHFGDPSLYRDESQSDADVSREQEQPGPSNVRQFNDSPGARGQNENMLEDASGQREDMPDSKSDVFSETSDSEDL
ncbi:hypothetical protein Btru_068567 [Bulinus truncatus]|nr:hypothetical protein Btru_068567 [Bulinus truncatus]